MSALTLVQLLSYLGHQRMLQGQPPHLCLQMLLVPIILLLLLLWTVVKPLNGLLLLVAVLLAELLLADWNLLDELQVLAELQHISVWCR